MSEFSDDSVEKKSPRRGVRGWLSDLFSEAPDDVAALLEVLQDAAERQLIDVDALNIIVGALHVADMHARDIMIPPLSAGCGSRRSTACRTVTTGHRL